MCLSCLHKAKNRFSPNKAQMPNNTNIGVFKFHCNITYILYKFEHKIHKKSEPCHEKTNVLHMRKQGRKSASRQRLCFCYIDSTIRLLSKSEISSSSHLLWLYSLVCVGPGRKPERWFSHDAAQVIFSLKHTNLEVDSLIVLH